MFCLFPRKLDTSAFGNKYKCLLTCVATGFPTYANALEGFEGILDPSAYQPKCQGYAVDTWRLPVPVLLNHTLDERFTDSLGERFGTPCPEVQMIYSHDKVIDHKYQEIPQAIRDWYLRGQEWIPWSSWMRSAFTKVDEKFSGRILGVSVRTWRAPHDCGELNDRRVREFDVNVYLNHIKRFEGKVDAMYISFDNKDVEHYFKDIQIPRIELQEPPGLTTLQWATLKARALSRCSALIGNRESTFIEAAWWMGGCLAEVILV
jgi:hypothetical protein